MSTEKPKVYKASTVLQQKIGVGPLDPVVIEQAQKAIEENDVDFAPLGLEFLQELQSALTAIKGNIDPEKVSGQKKALTDPVMELKANATIFHYPLIGNLANVMLSFLESIKNLDEDAISIVRAHHDTLKLILMKKMRGNGGQHGHIMVAELKDACARYHKKQKKQKK